MIHIQSRIQLGETPSAPGDEMRATAEEVAAALSEEEGRTVTVQEVRRIEFIAMRKLRRTLALMGLTSKNLLPED